MEYIKQNLAPDEDIVCQLKPHWGIFFKPMLIVGLLMIACGAYTFLRLILAQGGEQVSDASGCVGCAGCLLLLGFVDIGIAAVSYFSSALALTPQRIIGKWGLYRRAALDLPLADIQQVKVSQPFYGKLLGYGTLTLLKNDNSQEKLAYIGAPAGVAAQIRQQLGPSGG